MSKIITTFLALLFFTTAFAQDSTATKKKESLSKQYRKITWQQIGQLHDGALLVRLKTKKNTIEALRKMGRDNKAEMVEAKQNAFNKEVIRVFKEYFTFCPYYFFFSDDSEAVKEKQFDSVGFLNDKLVIDSTITFDMENFLTAEFGVIEQDTAKYFDGYRNESVEEGVVAQTQYYGGPDLRFGALIIKSDQFAQLCKPFPYYVRTFDSVPVKFRTKNAVKKMNRNLHYFYKRMIDWKLDEAKKQARIERRKSKRNKE